MRDYLIPLDLDQAGVGTVADPAYRSSSSVIDQTTGPFSVSKPTGTTDGDILTAYQATNLGGGSAPATPTGWTLKDTQTFSTAMYVLQRFEKLAASEGASWNFNGPGGSPPSWSSSVYIVCSSPGDTASEGSSKTSGSSTSADPGSYTTLASNELIISAWAATPGHSIVADASFTSLGTIGNGVRLNVGYKTAATAGVVANRSATISATGDWGAILAAIPPPNTTPFNVYPPQPGIPITILTM